MQSTGFDAPWFDDYQPLARTLAPHVANGGWIAQLNTVLADARHAFCLRADDRTWGALAYEQQIANSHKIPSRSAELHDLFNALVWWKFPQTKAALNALHVREGAASTANQRSALRNALTVFDEVGVIVQSAHTDLRDALRDHAWQTLFVQNRVRWRADVRVIVFGHGLLESLARHPHLGLTGKVLWLTTEIPTAQIDATLSNVLLNQSDVFSARLMPLPIFGVPGWHADNDDAQFYKNAAVFRPLSKIPA